MKGMREGQPYLKRKAMVNVYLEPDEKQALVKRCEETGVTMSTYFRMMLRRDLFPQSEHTA